MNFQPPKHLITAAISSLIIFFLLFTARLCCPQLLDIDVKWLTIALIPFVIMLISNNYLKKFIGLGLELEFQVQEPISYSSEVIDFARTTSAVDKGEIKLLYDLSEVERLEINTLRFTTGRHDDYYDEHAISAYLNKLPKVEFVEIVDDKGKLEKLFRVRRSRNTGSLDRDNFPLARKILAAVNQNIQHPSLEEIREIITQDESVIEALKKFKEINQSLIAIVTKNGKLIGVVQKEKIQEHIANIVLKQLDTNK